MVPKAESYTLFCTPAGAAKVEALLLMHPSVRHLYAIVVPPEHAREHIECDIYMIEDSKLKPDPGRLIPPCPDPAADNLTYRLMTLSPRR